MVQHADKLAALDRRESDLKAQQHSLASDAQAFKDKEGENPNSHCDASCRASSHVEMTILPHVTRKKRKDYTFQRQSSCDHNTEAARAYQAYMSSDMLTHMTAACKLCAMRPFAQTHMQVPSSQFGLYQQQSWPMSLLYGLTRAA